ncbi:MAG: trehalase family glycosidase [Planctomycetota bacterium]
MNPVPDIYGGGILLAFSGLDGPTDFDRPLIASTLPEKVGLRTHFSAGALLFFEVRPEDIVPSSRNAVANDFWDLAVRTRSIRGRVRMAFVDCYSMVFESPARLFPVFFRGRQAQYFHAPTELISQGLEKDDAELAVVIRRRGRTLRTALARADADGRSASVTARAALATDLDALLARRRAFFRKLPILANAVPLRQRTEAKAFSILKVNVESAQGEIPCRWTTPDRYPHRQMWLWDSGFHAMANRLLDPELAKDTLSAVLHLAREDGYVSLCANPHGRLQKIESQPPVLAWATWRVYESCRDTDFLRFAYPKLAAFIRWMLENRRSPASDLLQWHVSYENERCRCGESGLDNAPQWDVPGPAEAPDLNGLICNEFEMLARIADTLGLSHEAADWRRSRERFVRLLNERLWDERDGIYYNRGTLDGKLRRVKTLASFYPLLGGVPDARRARRLARHLFDPKSFWRPAGLASTAADDPGYTDDMWRGPVWLVLNYIVACGLARCGLRAEADRIARATTRLVEKWYRKTGVIFEFYDAEDRRDPRRLARKGYSPFHVIEDYHWSAAIYILMRRRDFGA